MTPLPRLRGVAVSSSRMGGFICKHGRDCADTALSSPRANIFLIVGSAIAAYRLIQDRYAEF